MRLPNGTDLLVLGISALGDDAGPILDAPPQQYLGRQLVVLLGQLQHSLVLRSPTTLVSTPAWPLQMSGLEWCANSKKVGTCLPQHQCKRQQTLRSILVNAYPVLGTDQDSGVLAQFV